MPQNPIVEEIRRLREEYSARFNYDLKAICRAAREHQAKGRRKTVSNPPRRPDRAAKEAAQPIA